MTEGYPNRHEVGISMSSREALQTPRGQRFLRELIDLAVLATAFAAAFAYRFELPLPDMWAGALLMLVVPVVLVEWLALRIVGAHRHTWRYVSIRDAEDVLLAMTGVMGLLLVLRFVPGRPTELMVPLGVILLNWLLTIGGLVGVRALRRLLLERDQARHAYEAGGRRDRVLLLGAGQAGGMVARELARRPDTGLRAVGFLDDDPAKLGRRVHGLEVLGTTDEVGEVAEAHQVEQVVITMASVSRADIRRITERCQDAGLDVRIIPGLFEIVGGQVDLGALRPIQVEDLLGRDPVDLDRDSLDELLAGRTVLVTGAGGSIGSELCRQAARFGPAELVLVERSEPALWAIETELQRDHPDVRVVAAIGDVGHRDRISAIVERHAPDVVVHAAAHKHVPMMERHPGEAVRNNVGATRTLVDVCAAAEVPALILVSTDKAVNPGSVMGATKRVCELYVQHVARRTGLRYVAVRFGNVLGSAGSVVPIFREQVKRGGPVTVTHPDMVRFFMTIPEAAGLVLQAGALGQPGEVLVLDMGEPVRIVDLAENVIRLSGFEPHADIEIEFTGVRPGEKLFEELSLEQEHATRTRHPKVFIGQAVSASGHISEEVDELLSAVNDDEHVRALLTQVVTEFQPEDPSQPVQAADV